MDIWKFPFLSSNILRIFPKSFIKIGSKLRELGCFKEIPLHGAQENIRGQNASQTRAN